MKAKIFYLILAICLITKPITASNLPNSFASPSKDTGVSVFSDDELFKEELDNDKLEFENRDIQPKKQDFELQKSIAKYLPEFFENNKQMLEKLQEGQRQAVVVIGQTGVGKSTIIGALLGHEFGVQKKEVTEIWGGEKISYSQEVLMNKTPGAPTIGHSTTTSETIWPKAYLDPKANLAFIDTAGLGDTRKDGDAINICNALGLRSLIEAIGGVKCIVGVINYELFKAGKESNTFLNLLNVTSGLLKNTSPETLTSSMVLVFTKAQSNITKKDITNELTRRRVDFIKKTKIKQMTDNDKVAEGMYKILFPSCYNIKNKQDVPFFLISQESLLQQGHVRENMLPTLQKAIKVDSKHIGLMLHPHLLQKTTDWLAKRTQSIANDIREQKNTEQKITNTNKYLSFKEEKLQKEEETLQDLTNPNNKNEQETFKKHLENTLQKNTQRIQELKNNLQNNKNQQKDAQQRINELNTNDVRLYKRISGRYNKENKYYEYSYNDVPIHHIVYSDRYQEDVISSTFYNRREPKLGDRVSDNYKVVAITKNYNQGRLNISLENNMDKILGSVCVMVPILGWGLLYLAKYANPGYFKIYAQKKHIFRDSIKAFIRDIKNLEEISLQTKKNKEKLEKKNRINKDLLQKLQSNKLIKDQLKNNKFSDKELKQVVLDVLEEENMIEQTKKNIQHEKQAIKKIKKDLQILKTLLPLLIEKLEKNEIIATIITHVEPFIDFHDNCKNDIELCKEYYMKKPKKKHNQDNTNKKHTDIQLVGELEERKQDDDNNVNYINVNDQPGGELEERKEDDEYDDHNNNVSSLTSSLLLGTSLLVNSVSKKKN